jgi:predicted methyltransferase
LTFFGVKDTQNVVEIWPGGQGGWYRSILAPYLAENGTYIPVRSRSDFPAAIDTVKDNSADRVLVFRAHGFMIYDNPAQEYFNAIFKMLKPGGVLGIVDHRGDESIPQDPKGENGYVNQSHVLMLAKNAGLELIDSAEINANPKDTKDYPSGLYSLPPTLKGSTFNRPLRDKVLAIGESDRMTLKFVKPL